MGTFVLEGDGADFNLAPRPDVVEPIPEEQRKISQEVYEARNILVLLRERGVFRNDTVALDEFITRVRQAATVGCVNNNVQTQLAIEALQQIRNDILRRKWLTIVSSATSRSFCLVVVTRFGSRLSQADVGDLSDDFNVTLY